MYTEHWLRRALDTNPARSGIEPDKEARDADRSVVTQFALFAEFLDGVGAIEVDEGGGVPL